MSDLQERHPTGLEAVEIVARLMQRVRTTHPTFGLYEAAELHWWWTIPRSTDTFPQLVWFDDEGPAAAATITDFGVLSSALYTDPILVVTVLPGSSAEWVTHVLERGLQYAAERNIETVELEVDRTDELQRDLLFGRDFEIADEGLVQCWLDAAARPAVSALHDGYRLARRSESGHLPHHMADDRRPDIEERLRQTSLYRADLDLVVYDGDDAVAAYGLFWYDPVSSTGVIEPMRTHDDHQQRGLARHVLTAGIEFLAEAGARRISIGYEPSNPASGHLYRSVGFEPHQQTDLLAGPTASRVG